MPKKGIHGHQKKTLAFFVLGIVLSGSAVLQRVAEVLQERGKSLAKMTSIERRLARFLANERIVVPQVWKLFLAQVLSYFRGKKLSFVLDLTPFQDESRPAGLSRRLMRDRLLLALFLAIWWTSHEVETPGAAGSSQGLTAPLSSSLL